jgi:hypothetical protein
MARKQRQKGVTGGVTPGNELSEVEQERFTFNSTRQLSWVAFFSCQTSPVLRSQMLTVLMAGTQLEAARVPIASLLDAVLIAFAARTYCEAEIVDNFRSLCDRTEELWKDPAWTTKVFDSMHANAANFIINHGSREFAAVEEQYIPEFVAWYLGHDCPDYFEYELTERQMEQHWGLKKRRAA